MPRSIVETQAIVLHKENSNENFIRFEFFCPNNGKLSCLSRLEKKKALSNLPDLFDLVTLQLNPARLGSLFFLKDFQVTHHHSGISKNYSAFYYACRLSSILSTNLLHIDRPQALFSLTQKTFHALEHSSKPESAYLKALYLFARQEGYPVKEHWLSNLEKDLLDSALIILKNPLKNQNLPSPVVKNLVDHLELWVQRQTDILVPLTKHPQLFIQT